MTISYCSSSLEAVVSSRDRKHSTSAGEAFDQWFYLLYYLCLYWHIVHVTAIYLSIEAREFRTNTVWIIIISKVLKLTVEEEEELWRNNNNLAAWSDDKQGFFCKVPLSLLASSARVLYCLWYHTLNIKRHISARKICRSNALVKSAISNEVINRRKFIFWSDLRFVYVMRA